MVAPYHVVSRAILSRAVVDVRPVVCVAVYGPLPARGGNLLRQSFFLFTSVFELFQLYILLEEPRVRPRNCSAVQRFEKCVMYFRSVTTDDPIDAPKWIVERFILGSCQ